MSAMQNTYALIIGIANYHNICRLPATVTKDAQDIYDLLINPQYCGYLQDNVQLLLDQEASCSNIQKSLVELSQKAKSDSTVFIYFSGHGGHYSVGNQTISCLLTVDTQLNSHELPNEKVISGEDFTKALREISARKVIVIFDCCHAGGIGETKSPSIGLMKTGIPEDYYDSLNQGNGRVIMASSRSDESSYVLRNSDNSLFTSHLLAGLRGEIISNDGLIRIFNLFEYIQSKVTIEEPRQHPIFKADIEENFPISLYRGGQERKAYIEENFPISLCHGNQEINNPNTEKEFIYNYDLFICFTDVDENWVEGFLMPFLDIPDERIITPSDFELGEDRVTEYERAVKDSRYTLLILSQAFLSDSDVWEKYGERIASYARVAQERNCLIPIKLEPCELPPRLDSITPIDCTNEARRSKQISRLRKFLGRI